jgi:hypothetical protein
MTHPGVWVTLTPIEIEFCDQLGIDRNTLRTRSGSRHTNNRRVSEAQAILGHQLGTRTECAGKTYLWMTIWHIEPLADPSKVPDLEHPRMNIDVKGVQQHHHQLISPAAALKHDWAYLLVSAQEHPRYWIRGWCRGHDLAAAPVRELQPGRPCHAFLPGALLPPQQLLEILK